MLPAALITAAFLAFASVVVSSPGVLQQRSSFTLNQVAAKNVSRATAAEHKEAAFRKYGIPVDESLAKSVKRAKEMRKVNGTVDTLLAIFEPIYLTPITVGRFDSLHVVFDTGNYDLWVYSNLQPREQLRYHDIYHAYKPKVKKGFTFYDHFLGDARVYGNVYADHVRVDDLLVKDQAFGAAIHVPATFTHIEEVDGILGLAFNSRSAMHPHQLSNWYDNIKPSLASPLFAVALRKSNPGSIDFGATNPYKYKGKLAWAIVNNKEGYWGVFVTNTGVLEGQFEAIIDTGTAFVILQPEYVDAYYAKVDDAYFDKAEQAYVFPCTVGLPSFWIKIGINWHATPGRNFAMWSLPNNPRFCYGGLQASRRGKGRSILGLPFIQGKYIVHLHRPGKDPRIGIAELAKQ